MCLCISLLAVTIGGTWAYFTDTDTETNTFTVGNIEIDLIEKNKDGSDFTQNQVLMPGEDNGIVKDVTVKNIGAQKAYMWIEVWLPAVLDNTNAAQNNLHFNPFDTYKFPDGTVKPMRGSVAKGLGGVIVAETNSVDIGVKKINDISYHGYRINIIKDTPKKKGESTASLLYRVYMDARVTQCAEHNNGYMLLDGTCYTGSWEIIVNAFGIQADGFDTIDAAMAAYYAG